MSPPGRSRIVLVVEDDPDLRSLYREALSLIGGYVVVAVEDGVDALRQIDHETPAAVVLDLQLPRLSGVDVQRELSAHPDTDAIPIVIVTGDPARVDPSAVACVLRKPVDVSDLIAAVRKCIGQSR